MSYVRLDIDDARARLSELIEDIHLRHTHYVITKNGEAVADLVPSNDAQRKQLRERGVETVVAQVKAGPYAEPFRDKYKHLAWSNSGCPDDVVIAQALQHAQLEPLLHAVLEYGLPHVRKVWEGLISASSPEALKAKATTELCLEMIEIGLNQGTTNRRPTD